MKELKRIFSFLTYTCKKEYYKALWIVAIVDCLEIVITAQLYYSSKKEGVICCLYDNHLIVLLLVVLVIGFLYGSREFGGYMEIVAKRKEYLIGALSYIGLLSLGSVALNRMITLVLSSSIIYILGIPGELFSPIALIKEWMIYLVSINLGFFIGAAFYRIRKSTFWVISIGVGTVLRHIDMGGYYLGMNMDMIQQRIGKIAEHFGVTGIVLTSVFMLGSVLFLRKAPIKIYARDLL